MKDSSVSHSEAAASEVARKRYNEVAELMRGKERCDKITEVDMKKRSRGAEDRARGTVQENDD